jgi:hypothetical protein
MPTPNPEARIVFFSGGPLDGERMTFLGMPPFDDFAIRKNARILLHELNVAGDRYKFVRYITDSELRSIPDVLGPTGLPKYDVVEGPE